MIYWLKEVLRKQFPEICWKYQVENMTQLVEHMHSGNPPELILVEGTLMKEMRSALKTYTRDSNAECIAATPGNVNQPISQVVKLPSFTAGPSPLLIRGLKNGLSKVYMKRGAIFPGSCNSGSIRFEDLMYIRGEGSYSRFYLAQNAQVLSSRPLGFFQYRLPECRFTRIHKSFIVNLDFVEKQGSNSWHYLSLTDQQTVLPVSLRRVKKLKSMLMQSKYLP